MASTPTKAASSPAEHTATKIAPAQPSTPLNPLSPNQVQNTSRKVPESPSVKSEVIPGYHKIHTRTSSDVQGMVARFNNLDIKDHAEMHKKDMAALRRAQMGREEAEADLKKQREEVRRLKKDQDESRDRERKVMKRIDVLMEELHRAKETHQHAQGLYEKEIRKARKEAFKSSSVVVKMQEELASTRKGLKVAQADLKSEKLRGERKDQEVFQSKYELVNMHEKLTQALSQLKIVEEERDALKTNLREEEVARIAAQGHIALPTSRDDDEFGTPRRSPLAQPRPREPSKSREVDDLRREVELERRQRALAEEQVDFMKMECEFQCCSCRVKESRQGGYRPRQSLMRRVAEVRPKVDSPMDGDDEHMEDIAAEDCADAVHVAVAEEDPAVEEPAANEPCEESHIDATTMSKASADVSFSPQSGTFRSRGTAARPVAVFSEPEPEPETGVEPASEPQEQHQEPVPAAAIVRPTTPSVQISRRSRSARYSRPLQDQDQDQDHESPVRVATPEAVTPANVAIKTVTTTTTVPLVDSQSPGYSAFFPEGNMLSREEALERIRERRGRARSITGTPAKRAASNTPRRDISAPMGSAKPTPKSAGRVGRG